MLNIGHLPDIIKVFLIVHIDYGFIESIYGSLNLFKFKYLQFYISL